MSGPVQQLLAMGWRVLLGLLGLLRLQLAELGNLDHDGLVDALLELWPISCDEEQLEPDEQGRQEDGLEEVVQQRRRAALEFAVANKLGDPAHDVHRDGNLVGTGGILQAEVVGTGGRSQADECQGTSCDGLKKEIQATPCHGRKGAQVRVEVRHLEPGRQCEEGAIVGKLGPRVRKDWYLAGGKGEGEGLHTTAKNENKIRGTQTM